MLPTEALAAKKVRIQMPVKVGFLTVGGSYNLKPKVSGISRSALTWESSNSSVVSVDGSLLTGAAEGLAVVRASGGGAQATCGVVVLPESVTLSIGDTYSLPYNSILKYSTSKKSIAAVSKKGVITAVSAGTTKIKVSYNGVSGTVKVTVNKAANVQSKAAQLDCANSTDQIILVEYKGGSKATVSFHEKVNGVWTELYSTTGYVGSKGIGKTKEGDKKTPSGTYNLTAAFGIKSDPGSNLPYTKVTKYHYWCGTSGSEYYNQMVDSRVTGRKATSSDEKLINYKGVYNYCLFIDYNAFGEAGKGSCIFLHCTGSKKSTAGCIAIPEKVMKKAVCWVREGAKIVIQ